MVVVAEEEDEDDDDVADDDDDEGIDPEGDEPEDGAAAEGGKSAGVVGTKSNDADVGMLEPLRCPDRIDGLRILVGNTPPPLAPPPPAAADDDDAPDTTIVGFSLSSLVVGGVFSLNAALLSTSFLNVGLTGGLPPSLPLSLPPPLLSRFSAAKSKILAKFNPTLGDELNKLESSAGLGVARTSPVVVRTTPFIADGSESVYDGRVMGVSRTLGKACWVDEDFGVACESCCCCCCCCCCSWVLLRLFDVGVSCNLRVMFGPPGVFLTSSRGVFVA